MAQNTGRRPASTGLGGMLDGTAGGIRVVGIYDTAPARDVGGLYRPSAPFNPHAPPPQRDPAPGPTTADGQPSGNQTRMLLVLAALGVGVYLLSK